VQVPKRCVSFSVTRHDGICDSYTSVVKVIAPLLDKTDTIGKAGPSRSAAGGVGLVWEAGSIVWGNRVRTVWGQGRVLPVARRSYL
jgi:hypothetical protein